MPSKSKENSGNWTLNTEHCKARLTSATLIALLVIILDQASKAWILYDLMNPPSVIKVLPFLDFVLAWNKGVGFGMLQAHSIWGTIGLIALATAISASLGVWIWRTTDKLLLISLSMVIGGAIGNIIDRLRFDGAVVDFIYVPVYIFGYHFPAFNIADSAITVGVCLLILESYVRKKN
jgi:signal peptidase II